MSKTIIITEEQYKRIFLKEQQDVWDFGQSGTPYDEFKKTGKLRDNSKTEKPKQNTQQNQSYGDFQKYIDLPKEVNWRPKGYTAEEIQKKYLEDLSKEKEIASKDGCQCDCYMGNCLYRCGNKSSVLNGQFCGNSKKGLKLSPVNHFMLGDNISGYAIINNSIDLYNKTIKHKFSIQDTFGWSSSNVNVDDNFLSEGNLGKKFENIDKTQVINPEYIGVLLDTHLRGIEKLGDSEKDQIVASFNRNQALTAYNNKISKLKKDGWLQTLPSEIDKTKQIIKQENVTKPDGSVDKWYKVEDGFKLNYQELQSIPGLTEPDRSGGSWSNVPNLKQEVNRYVQSIEQPFTLKIRKLSELEKQTKSLEQILEFINNHNQEILKQTIELYKKTECGKSPGKNKYTSYDIPPVKQMCAWGKSGVWIYPTDNINVFKCDCVSSQASKQQHMGNYGTVSSEMTGSVDIRSDWKKFTDSLTWHTAFQAASAVLVWFPPYGTAAAAGLEVLDGLLYLHEGDTFSGGLTIAFSLSPASKLFKGFKSIGSGGVEKIHKVIKNSEKIKSNTAKLQQMIKQAHKELDGKELKTFYELIRNPQDVIKVNNKLKSLEGLTSKDKFIKLAEDINDNIRLKEVIKEMEPMVRKKILGDMTDSEKIVYSTLLGGTTPLTMDDKTGEKEEKSPEDIVNTLGMSGGNKKGVLRKKGEVSFCVDCVEFDSEVYDEKSVSKYNTILNNNKAKSISSETISQFEDILNNL